AYVACGSNSAVPRCRLNVRFARERTWNMHQHGSNAVAVIATIRRTGRYGMSRAGLLRLDVGRSDHLAPLLSFVGNEPSKVGGREHEHIATEVKEPCLEAF